MAKALYRTHRSKSFDEVIGQQHVTDILKHAVATKRFSHAYLLTGPRGVGKTSVARILAHAINQLPYNDETTHIDIIEIDAASNRRIDDIRDLREKVHIAPAAAKFKIYIIDEVHMLTSESFNALLKTLEEPPAHAIFILATTDPQKLPATILSRTQHFTFRLVAQDVLVTHLKAVAAAEEITIDDEALKLIAQHSEGTVRDSLSLLDQVASVDTRTITASDVEAVIGTASHQHIAQLCQAIHTADSAVVLEQLRSWQQLGISPTTITKQVCRQLLEQPTPTTNDYQLIDALQAVFSAYDPSLKLLTTILLHITNTPSASTPSRVSKTTPLAVAAPPTISRPAARPVADTKKPKSSAKPKKTPTPNTDQGSISHEQWVEALEGIASDNPPLHAVLAKTATNLSEDGTTLFIRCRFGLHARKLDDPKYRQYISKSIAAISGGNVPLILIKTDPSLAKPAPDTSDASVHQEKTTDQTDSVIAIMGGGEVINAA